MPAFTRLLFAPLQIGILPAALLAGLLALQACTPISAVRGNNPDPDRIAQLEPGRHKRADVMDILGSPSSVSAFKPETWLYVSKRTETIAFLEPEVKESNVIALSFDEDGLLKEIKTLGLEEMRDVNIVERSTPTVGNEVGVLEQLIGNFGRFGQGGSGPAQ